MRNLRAFFFILLSGITVPSFLFGTGPGKKLKIMSYNIRIASPPSKGWGHTDLAAIANTIKSQKPDLVALQEVDAFTERSGKQSFQARELGEMTGMHYVFAKAVDRSGGDYGVAILSRYPVISSETHRLPVTEGSEGEVRGVAVVEIALSGKQKLYFLSAHLDHQSDQDRQYQVDSLLRIIDRLDRQPVVLGADLNMEPGNPVLDGLTQRMQPVSTRNFLTFPADNPKVTLDYILLNKAASGRMKLEKLYTVPETYASDHLPLVAELIVR